MHAKLQKNGGYLENRNSVKNYPREKKHIFLKKSKTNNKVYLHIIKKYKKIAYKAFEIFIKQYINIMYTRIIKN